MVSAQDGRHEMVMLLDVVVIFKLPQMGLSRWRASTQDPRMQASV